MKKLMIAVATAAMVSGAFADLCDDDPVTTSCAVYNVKFTFKSLDTKLLKVKGSSSACGDVASECCTYFENATYKFDGIIWDCDGDCDTLSTTDDSVKFVLWSTKAKMPVSAPLQWSAGDMGVGGEWKAGETDFTILDRYSKKANKVQAYWLLDGLNTAWESKAWDTPSATADIQAAGFGTFDVKNGRVKSISGNAVATFGVPTIPEYYNATADWKNLVTIFSKQMCDNPNPGIVILCDEFDSWCDAGADVETVAASGTWSVKYNASLSKGTKGLSKIVPSYAQKSN